MHDLPHVRMSLNGDKGKKDASQRVVRPIEEHAVDIGRQKQPYAHVKAKCERSKLRADQ